MRTQAPRTSALIEKQKWAEFAVKGVRPLVLFLNTPPISIKFLAVISHSMPPMDRRNQRGGHIPQIVP